jgi:hypothetical protein
VLDAALMRDQSRNVTPSAKLIIKDTFHAKDREVHH